MTCDIFIRTYSGDDDYHPHCLASIEKFCTGFRDVVVVKKEHPQGYLDQQVAKLHADLHTDADFILVTDSDTLFTRPTTPETFMVDGKPIWIKTPAEELKGLPGPEAWFTVMREFFGFNPEYEFMRRQPFVFPRRVLLALREWCELRHGMTMENYIMSRKAFSEWNVLGMFCHEFFHRDFRWVDTSKDELPELAVKQFWSHTPIGENLEEIQRILA